MENDVYEYLRNRYVCIVSIDINEIVDAIIFTYQIEFFE